MTTGIRSFVLCLFFLIVMRPKRCQPSKIPMPLTSVHGEHDIVQEHNLLPFEQQQSVIVPENRADTACSPMLPEAFVNSIVEKVVERIANPFSHIPATSDVPVATTSAAHSCPQSLSITIVDNNASSPTNTFISDCKIYGTGPWGHGQGPDRYPLPSAATELAPIVSRLLQFSLQPSSMLTFTQVWRIFCSFFS